MKTTFLFLLFLNFSICFSQNKIEKPLLVSSEKLEADQFIGNDLFGNLYYIKNSIFYKQNNHQSLQYQNVLFGKIKKVDILNPLKIVIFYEDFNAVVILDNQLNAILKIEFSNLKTPILCSGIGLASGNRLWVFDSILQQILLFDFYTKEFKEVGVPLKTKMIMYQTNYNSFVWVEESYYCFVTTIFGEVTKLGTISDLESMQYIDKRFLFYKKENNLYRYDFSTNESIKIEIDDKSIENYWVNNQILSIFTNQTVNQYKINLP